MLIAIVFAGFITVVGLLSWRLKDSAYAPRNCCSNHRWPPDDLTGRAGVGHRTDALEDSRLLPVVESPAPEAQRAASPLLRA